MSGVSVVEAVVVVAAGVPGAVVVSAAGAEGAGVPATGASVDVAEAPALWSGTLCALDASALVPLLPPPQAASNRPTTSEDTPAARIGENAEKRRDIETSGRKAHQLGPWLLSHGLGWPKV
jgi:hypothetical protein